MGQTGDPAGAVWFWYAATVASDPQIWRRQIHLTDKVKPAPFLGKRSVVKVGESAANPHECLIVAVLWDQLCKPDLSVCAGGASGSSWRAADRRGRSGHDSAVTGLGQERTRYTAGRWTGSDRVLPVGSGRLNVGAGRSLPLAFTRPGWLTHSRTGCSPTTLQMNGECAATTRVRPAQSAAERVQVPERQRQRVEMAQTMRYC